MSVDVLIVGAGLFGATVAREMLDRGATVLVIDRRNHIAGNCYDEITDGIRMCIYGGHIFHTNSRRIWDYASRFTEWECYAHKVMATSLGKVYSFPPNLMTAQQVLADGKYPGEREYRRLFFEGYSQKQWGKPLEELPPHILKRIPVRNTWDDRYFDDPYQGLPAKGYTEMIGRMLDGAEIELEADYIEDRGYWNAQARTVVYTGPLDKLYGEDLGRLEYRSLVFDHKRHEIPDYQGCATMNYCDTRTPYTRRMEWKHFWRTPVLPYTWVTTEYPADYDGNNEPYYPVGDDANKALHAEYKRRAEREGLYVGGRLGNYAYINMDQAIGAGLALAGGILTPQRNQIV